MISRGLFVAIAVVAFALDRVSKLAVQHSLELGEQHQLVGNVLRLRYVQNRGIAFGMFSDAGSLVLVGSLIVGVLLFVFLLRVDATDTWSRIGGACILGGALGNLYDRIELRYVVDFINVPRFPTFNIADVAITTGVVCIIIGQLRLAADAHETGGTK